MENNSQRDQAPDHLPEDQRVQPSRDQRVQPSRDQSRPEANRDPADTRVWPNDHPNRPGVPREPVFQNDIPPNQILGARVQPGQGRPTPENERLAEDAVTHNTLLRRLWHVVRQHQPDELEAWDDDWLGTRRDGAGSTKRPIDGVIKNLDYGHGLVELDDGLLYRFDPAKVQGLRNGDRVHVEADNIARI
jgi:hypothetical protein